MFSPIAKGTNWLYAISLTSSLSLLRVYSNFFMKINNKLTHVYYTNNTAKEYMDGIGGFFHRVYQFVSRNRVEPFFNPWCSISYFKDGKFNENIMNLNHEKLYLPFIRCSIINTKFCDLNTEEMVKCKLNGIMNNLTETCNFVKNIYFHEKQRFLIIMKIKHFYISRVGESSGSEFQEISFEHTPKFFLSIEYTHPEMDSTVYLDIDSGFFLQKNEILSMPFVKRLLEHQPRQYIFDDRYKLKILNWYMSTVVMDANDYMLLDKNDYQIITPHTTKK